MCALPLLAHTEIYPQFQPQKTSRVIEDTEWSTTYTFKAKDTVTPRLLLIGDSICNAYREPVRKLLDNSLNLTFWASSKCVTDKNYFRELEFILDTTNYSLISFNNGLHSLGTNRQEYQAAYRAALRMIKAKCPNAKLFVTTSTPLKNPDLTSKAQELNAIATQIASEENLPVLDLFTLMNPLERETFWSDTFHFKPEAIQKQAEAIAQFARQLQTTTP